MIMPLPDNARAPAPRTPAERDRARVKLARKWAYLISTTAYVPLVQTDIEAPLLELVTTVFDALARDPLGIEDGEAVGARLVALHCVDKSSLRCTVDVLAGALLSDQDTQGLTKLPERVAKLLGAVGAGFAEAVRRRTADQQDSMCRALIEIAKKAMRTVEAREEEFGEMSTELSLLQRQISHQLLHDALTGLPNRQFFTTRLEEVLNSGSPTTLYRVELNGLPVINDGLGWPRADSLLTSVAVRVRTAVADENAMVARLDRGSFAVLQESTTDPAVVVGKIVDALRETTYVADLGLATTASIGVVRSPPHRPDPVEVLNAADMALRYAKDKGPGQWHLLAPNDDAHDRRMCRLAAIMPGAWETGQLKIGYRLRVGLADERPVGVDAFARWQEAELRGQPRCVELAEETGLSPQLTTWLLRGAAAALRTKTELPLAISLSPHQSAAPDLVDSVLAALDDIGLPAARLQVTMPAATVFAARDQVVANLTAFAAAGVETAAHDVGGFPADVVRLADLPLRMVRLTPALVAQARRAPRDSLAAKAMTSLVTLLHLAGITVAVDGIRSRTEVDWWRWAAADTATGPLFSPAHGPTDVAALFRT
jgi:diguanylate cyclase (GGDEF)-like protein